MTAQKENVGVGGHKPLTAASTFQQPGQNDEKSPASGHRRESSTLLTSEDNGSQDSSAHGQRSQSIFGAMESKDDVSQPSQESSIPQKQTMEQKQAEIIKNMDPGGEKSWSRFKNASLTPPITPDSLAELEMPRIINNPKLRHDVNFDQELHFRPNTDGSKGKEKIRVADDYWNAIEAELHLHRELLKTSLDSQPEQECNSDELVCFSMKRLPTLFQTMRDILRGLVPDYEQEAVNSRLDVELIIQQLEKGMYDLGSLAEWLAKILKKHCAPMRDNMVDRMRDELKLGASNQDSKTLVSGIRQLFAVLEAMKLDVANHQVRHMRPILVDDTEKFLQKYHAHRISINKITKSNIRDARGWLEIEQTALDSISAKLDLACLGSALLRDVLCSYDLSNLPTTFYLDTDRLEALQSELQARVYWAICCEVFQETLLDDAIIPRLEITRAATALHQAVTDIVGTSGGYVENLENIAAEIMRTRLNLKLDGPDYDANLYQFVERRLSQTLCLDCPAFNTNAEALFRRLRPRLLECVQQHSKLSAMQLQEQFLPPPPFAVPAIGMGVTYTPLPIAPRSDDPEDGIIRRLTHILVLHWHIWADLVYLATDDELAESSGDDNTPPSTPTPVPVSQAVYAPGKKWLPIGVQILEVDVPAAQLPTPAASPEPVEAQNLSLVNPADAEEGSQAAEGTEDRSALLDKPSFDSEGPP